LALRTHCPCCGKPFSAPEEYKGRKVDCPKCGHRFVLKTPEELAEEKAIEEKRREKQRNDLRRLELIERQERRGVERSGVPYYERFQTGVQPVRHYDPKAPSRFLRLRALSDLLLMAAYAGLMLTLLGVGLTVYSKVSGEIESLTVLLLCVIGWIFGGGLVYLLLKCLAELAFVFASIGDQQNDLVQLLRDLRENTDGKAGDEV